MRCLAFKLTAALLLVAACTERTPLEPVEGKILVSYQCTDDGPTQPGCPVEWSFQEELETDVAQDVGLATGGEYLWQGESFAVAVLTFAITPTFFRRVGFAAAARIALATRFGSIIGVGSAASWSM